MTDSLRARAAPPLAIVALGLVFFVKLALAPAATLYSPASDMLAEHVPAKRFLVRSFRETGELPLWCPNAFAGEPFIADPQVAAFYPPHALLYFLPEECLGAALSWLVALHVILAGLFMYAYARAQAQGRAAALVAAAAYMFAGKWLVHLLLPGHYVLVGLAWLPLVVLLLEEAHRRRSPARAAAAGAAAALLALGTHPQWTLYAGVLVVLWTLGTALSEAARPGAAALRWAGLGALAAAVAAGLGAVQLLPTLAAIPESSRAAIVADPYSGRSVAEGLLMLFGRPPAGLAWEYSGGLGAVLFASAALAPVLGGGLVRYRAALAVLLVAAGVAGEALSHALPGFDLFRFPTRILIVAGFPIAVLAGAAVERLFGGAELTPALRRRCRRVFAALVLAGPVVFLAQLWTARAPEVHWSWALLPFTAGAALWLLGRGAGAAPGLGFATLVLAESWALALPLVDVRPDDEVYAPSACVRYLASRRGEHGRIFDPVASPLGGGAPLAMIYDLEALRGDNPLDVRRFKEYLLFLRNEGGPLRADQDLLDCVLGELPMANRPLFDLVGARWVFQAVPPGGPGADPPGWRRACFDEAPVAYAGLVRPHGVQRLGPIALYENLDAFPRAFVVPEAAPLPERGRVLAALGATDLRRTVLIEGLAAPAAPGGEGAAFRPARIEAYEPNRVALEVADGPAGFLVLADVFYPGWTCTVDGAPRPVERADFLFRAVALAAGPHRVEFRFAPPGYGAGKRVSGAALAALGAWGVVGLIARRRRSKVSDDRVRET